MDNQCTGDGGSRLQLDDSTATAERRPPDDQEEQEASASSTGTGKTGDTVPEKWSPEQYTENLIHHVRWVQWRGRRVPMATQNENGPCPLLAIANLLLLRGDLVLSADTEVVAATNLINMIGDLLFQRGTQQNNNRLDMEQNVYDAMSVLPKLSTGLDVNVKFDGVFHFEYTSECIIFDLLNITLCHGWLSDPREREMDLVVGNLSYNQLVELIVIPELSKSSRGVLASAFHVASASQLTEWGLYMLQNALKEGQLAVFFRNNHFSVITKHNQRLYLLITDQGFLKEEHCVWETLDKIDGDSVFVDSNFEHVQVKPEGDEAQGQDVMQQIENDLLLALSLEKGDPNAATATAESDEQLAMRWQQEDSLAVDKERQHGGHHGATSTSASRSTKCTIM